MDDSPSATRRPKQARAIRTRERILARAEVAFATKGYEPASLTSDILEPTGVSVGSFYHQFSDKRAVLDALLDERAAWRQLCDAVTATASQQPTFDAAVRQGLLAVLDGIDRHPEPWAIHFRELHNPDPGVQRRIEASWDVWRDSIERVVARWIAEPAARAEGRVAFASFGLAGVLRSYLAADAATRRSMRDTVLDDVVAACVASFR